MVDTLISNANPQEFVSVYNITRYISLIFFVGSLQAMVRGLLSSSRPDVAAAFTAAARAHLTRRNIFAISNRAALFSPVETIDDAEGTIPLWAPTADLEPLLRRTRMAYGAGLGVESLETLTNIVEVVAETHWKEDDGVNSMENILAAIDQDISQAVESAKQQIEAGHIDDIERAGQVKEALFKALQKCEQSVGVWNAEMFPFPRGLESVRGWSHEQKTGR